jgi:hypothetical protein
MIEEDHCRVSTRFVCHTQTIDASSGASKAASRI